MDVWVIMGNDYPDAVVASEEAADAYCANKKAGRPDGRIYWRAYKFTMETK